MATPPLSDELAHQAANLYRQHGTQAGAARAAGIPEKTFASRIKVAAQRGMLLDMPPAMPGFRVSQVTTGPAGQSIKQTPEPGEPTTIRPGFAVSRVTTLANAAGEKIIEWTQQKPGPVTLDDAIERVKSAFSEYEGRAAHIPAPSRTSADLLTFIPCNDWHIRMLAWERETGVNWDQKIAERVIGAGIADAIERSPGSGIGVVLGGGDLMHADTNNNRTEQSGNVLDADGRHAKGLEAAQRLKVLTIDAALAKHDRVIVRILKGNHDEYSSIAIGYFLLAWYRNEPRVTVDVDQSLFWWHRFGSVMLGATHGHTVKLQDMAQIMAHRRAEDWGRTKFRYVHGFHVHHASKFQTEGGGVIAESHQAPIPQDAWHYGSGYLSGRSLQTITYHKDFGEISRVRVAILDGGGKK